MTAKFDGFDLEPDRREPASSAPPTAVLHAVVVLANFENPEAIREWVSRRMVNERHAREEIADISRPVAC
jgi:hypothetical protein